MSDGAPTPPAGFTLHRFTAGHLEPGIPIGDFGTILVWNPGTASWCKPLTMGVVDCFYATKPTQEQE